MLKAGCWLRSWAVLLLGCLFCGCGSRDGESPPAPPRGDQGADFKTQWQDESQFIVTAIVTDLAEMSYFAKFQRLPGAKHFSVAATEKPESTLGAPAYEIEVVYERGMPAIKTGLQVNGPIWAPEIYAAIVSQLCDTVGLKPADLIAPGGQDDRWLSGLAELTAGQLAQEDLAVSRALAERFRDAARHEKAALLLGAFLLREQSGHFFDVRSGLCRMTAHLALARKLAGPAAPTNNGRVAAALLSTLMKNQKSALDQLARLESASAAVQPWVRALRARNTDDYRPLDGTAKTSLEKIEFFRAFARAVDPDLAWNRLAKHEKTGVCDYARIVHGESYSVETGHELLVAGLAGELAEMSAVHVVLRGAPLKQKEMAQALNQPPERCLTPKGEVCIIGWGQWAMFFQRHLGHTLAHTYDFMERMWGVPESAADFSSKAEQLFSSLRLYPFVRWFNASTAEEYHRAVSEGLALTAATPHLVPVQCWNYLCWDVKFQPLNPPRLQPHISSWLKQNPPPGTAYEVAARIRHPNLAGQFDTISSLERLNHLAPYDEAIAKEYLNVKYQARATFEQVEAVHRPVLEYDSRRVASLARMVQARPAEYEALMLRAAAISPGFYYELARYFQWRQDDAKAARYYEKGMELHPDWVGASHYAGWLVRYYQQQGLLSKALALADRAAESYSQPGLQAKAELLESMGKQDEALEYYLKIEERYASPGEALSFLARHKSNPRYSRLLEERLGKLFPRGIEKTSLAQLQGAPEQGVSIDENNARTLRAGLRQGDIIVALYGIRVRNFEQYSYARETTTNSMMHLIIWRDGRYLEVNADQPGHRFLANFSTWPRR